MSLDRFLQAQENTYAEALAELKAGQKTGHWIWWIFPQLRGLGTSPNSTYYGLADEAEARAYLEHPVLGARFIECVRVVYDQLFMGGRTPLELMGSGVDVMKLRSSFELFYRHVFAAKELTMVSRLAVLMDRVLREKLGWAHPLERAPQSLTDFMDFDAFLASHLLGEGHVLMAGVAGAGKTLLLNTQLLPWLRAQRRHFVAIDFHGELDPVPREIVLDPTRQNEDYLAGLAADVIASPAVLCRKDPGWAHGAGWNPCLVGLINRVRAGLGPAKPWYLIVDVSSHLDELDAFWGFLPEAESYGCTIIASMQCAGRIPPELRAAFRVIAQFHSVHPDDAQALAPADVPDWSKVVTRLQVCQFLLKVGAAAPRGYVLRRTRAPG